MVELHYAAQKVSLQLGICLTFPDPSCYHLETATLPSHTLLYLMPFVMRQYQQSRVVSLIVCTGQQTRLLQQQ